MGVFVQEGGIPAAEKGAAGGVASLDASAEVVQLPAGAAAAVAGAFLRQDGAWVPVAGGVGDGVFMQAAATQSVAFANVWNNRLGYILYGAAPSWLTVDAANGIYTVNADGTYLLTYNDAFYTNGFAGTTTHIGIGNTAGTIYTASQSNKTNTLQTWNPLSCSVVVQAAAGADFRPKIMCSSTGPYSSNSVYNVFSIARIK